MRLFIQSAMIFFGTLLAAGLLALGEPPAAPDAAAQANHVPTLLLVQGAWSESTRAPAGR